MRKITRLVWTLAATIVPQAAKSGPVDSTGATRARLHLVDSSPRTGLLARGDIFYAIATAAALVSTVPRDEWLTSESDESRSRGKGALSRAVQPLGNSAVVLPALTAAWLAERVSGRSTAAGALGRMAVSVGAAGTGALLLKEVMGRPRPVESLHDSDDLMPFSGRSSLPSGHAAVAFALAAAINREAS